MNIPAGTVLVCAVRSWRANITFGLAGAMLDKNGHLIPINSQSPLTAAGVTLEWSTPLQPGNLIYLKLEPTLGPYRLGDAYAALTLYAGPAGASPMVETLVTGWPARRGPLWWSDAGIGISDPAALRPSIITVANPAAGVDWTTTLTNRALRRLIGVRWLLTCAAGGVARISSLDINPQATGVWRYTSATAVAGGTNRTFQFELRAAAELDDGVYVHVPISELAASDDAVIASNTVNIAAGDQISGVRLNLITETVYMSEWV